MIRNFLSLPAIAVAVLLLLPAASAPGYPGKAKPVKKYTRQQLMQKALKSADKQDTYAIIESVAGHQDPLMAAQMFADLTGKLYWDQKNLNAAVAMGRAGVQMALTEALPNHSKKPNLSAKLKNLAWSLSYDIASFTWPGWGEKSMRITATDIYIGLDAAKTNLRLTKELKKGLLAYSRANWIVGAQELASGETIAAIASFRAGALAAAKAGLHSDELLNTGFAQMTALLADPENMQIRAKLEATEKALLREKDGADFVQQIDTANRVFAKTPVK